VTLADLLLPDIEDEDIAERLIEVMSDFQDSIERMGQTMAEPDISGVMQEAIAEVRSETGT
jgi:spore coat protein CotF